MRIPFTKMQGCGNDYIYFNCFQHKIPEPEALAIRLSDRHFGVGGDGIILICPSRRADAEMRMFNADGSQGRMCGNGIRCVGKYLYDHGLVGDRRELLVDTLSGVKGLHLNVVDGAVETVRVDMGPAVLTPQAIPVRLKGDRVVDAPLSIGGRDYQICCVSMGNPHCVVFLEEDVDTMDLTAIGPGFEGHPLFPERINTEFVNVLPDRSLKLRVWERGSGETWACGTGACAAGVAAVLHGWAARGEDIPIHLRGGDLTVCCTEETVLMTGPAVTVFEGTVEL